MGLGGNSTANEPESVNEQRRTTQVAYSLEIRVRVLFVRAMCRELLLVRRIFFR